MTGLFHGTWWDQQPCMTFEALSPGRFTKLFKRLEPAEFDQAHLEQLARRMTSRLERSPTPEGERDPEEGTIPAAYTYLGQFVDHDLTFDPTSQLREFLTPGQINGLEDYRTPRFDLDNLYGRGPADQPYMYEQDGIRMLLGEEMSGNPFDRDARQVPRGPNGRALIGDPRNDENRIVAQLHAIFLRFHNKVADHLRRQQGPVTFDHVRNQVRWHYQWMLVTDFLPMVVNDDTCQRVFADRHHPAPGLPGLRNGRLKLMPVEFSVAAFRFGHSMIRPEYRLNTTVERRPIFVRNRGVRGRADDAADLGGFRPIPSDWAIDWQFFINLEQDGVAPAAAGPQFDRIARGPQMAYKIDTSLVSPLGHLPARIAKDPSRLALRNLMRGVALGLPSGQDVAAALGEKVIGDEDLVIGKATANDQRRPLLLKKIAGGFASRAPLWAYILSEAQVTSWEQAGGGASLDDIPIKLGPVGGRIVAGVFAALLNGDQMSYVRTDELRGGAPFTPIPEFTRDGRFGLPQLINVALGRTP
jgi:Animal haem peroxidase